MKKLIISILVLSLAACKQEPKKPAADNTDSTAQIKTDTAANTHEEIANKEKVLKKTNDEILKTLKDRDFKKFAECIHPQKGVRFSMYAFVDPKNDKQFSREAFEKYYQAKTLFTWGSHDGSGDPYKETIKNYLEKWVFSKDFTASSYSLNKFQGGGNSLNNLQEMYPKHDFTENYIKGTEKYGEMDWKTLRFVFEEFRGTYYLIAVVNDQWTI